MAYPEAVNLPFNGEVVLKRFVQRKPGELSDSAPGFWVVLQGDTLLMREGGLHRGGLPGWLVPEQPPVLFGEWDGLPVRVARVGQALPVQDPWRPVPLTELPDDLLTLCGLAGQILHWERMSWCCSRCGGTLERIDRSWGKRCVACGHQHFPHIHPCIIVLVRRGEEFLLVRKKEWAEGRYGLVAGFVDFGESLEECVQREVFEETGLRVARVRYVGSQSWPFPTQLMVGFVAEYREGEIAVDGVELEEAFWFSRATMPVLPPSRSISRWIIDTFA